MDELQQLQPQDVPGWACPDELLGKPPCSATEAEHVHKRLGLVLANLVRRGSDDYIEGLVGGSLIEQRASFYGGLLMSLLAAADRDPEWHAKMVTFADRHWSASRLVASDQMLAALNDFDGARAYGAHLWCEPIPMVAP